MKNEVSKPVLIGVIALAVVVVAVLGYMFVFPPAPSSPAEAGIGKPAKAGGGVIEEDPTPPANPYGPGGAPTSPPPDLGGPTKN